MPKYNIPHRMSHVASEAALPVEQGNVRSMLSLTRSQIISLLAGRADRMSGGAVKNFTGHITTGR